MIERVNILELFDQHVADQPEAIAITEGNSNNSYAQLDARSRRLGAILSKAGAEPDKTVALCLERSTDLITSVLGRC